MLVAINNCIEFILREGWGGFPKYPRPTRTRLAPLRPTCFVQHISFTVAVLAVNADNGEPPPPPSYDQWTLRVHRRALQRRRYRHRVIGFHTRTEQPLIRCWSSRAWVHAGQSWALSVFKNIKLFVGIFYEDNLFLHQSNLKSPLPVKLT